MAKTGGGGKIIAKKKKTAAPPKAPPARTQSAAPPKRTPSLPSSGPLINIPIPQFQLFKGIGNRIQDVTGGSRSRGRRSR